MARVLFDRATPRHYLDCVFEDADPSSLVNGFLVLGRLGIQQSEAQDWIRQVLRRDVRGRAEAASTAALTLREKTAQAPLAVVLASALEREGTAKLAHAFEGRLPVETVSLRELSVWTTEQLLQELPQGETGQETLAERARLLNDLGNRLSALGRQEEALEATQKTVEICCALAVQRPDAFLPFLTASLNNLGNQLSALRRREEALEATREAVEIRRALAEQRPDAFLPDLASSLNDLGDHLSALGWQEEALEATREAIEQCRVLVGQRPDAFLPHVAASLANLGKHLSALGRREEALDATREAVEQYRVLVGQRPDGFQPDLATSLNNMGILLDDLGRPEEALEATREAVQIRRALVGQRPDLLDPE